MRDAIKAVGTADNTIVILAGDDKAGNTTSPGIVVMEGAGSNGAWRGGLSTATDAGMHTPAMIGWPGKIASGGDTVSAAERRSMKVHFAASAATHSVIRRHPFPRGVDVREDREQSCAPFGDDGCAHAGVMERASKIPAGLAVRMQKDPNGRPGQDFAGYR